MAPGTFFLEGSSSYVSQILYLTPAALLPSPSSDTVALIVASKLWRVKFQPPTASQFITNGSSSQAHLTLLEVHLEMVPMLYTDLWCSHIWTADLELLSVLVVPPIKEDAVELKKVPKSKCFEGWVTFLKGYSIWGFLAWKKHDLGGTWLKAQS